jgi:hypothetical protein
MSMMGQSGLLKFTVLGVNMKAIIALIVIYITAFVTTYGHAYNAMSSAWIGENAIGAFISAVLWPLYWSVQLWR